MYFFGIVSYIRSGSLCALWLALGELNKGLRTEQRNKPATLWIPKRFWTRKNMVRVRAVKWEKLLIILLYIIVFYFRVRKGEMSIVEPEGRNFAFYFRILYYGSKHFGKIAKQVNFVLLRIWHGRCLLNNIPTLQRTVGNRTLARSLISTASLLF